MINKKRIVHEILKKHDDNYDKDDCQEYKLEISSKDSTEFIRMMNGFQVPGIKCLTYTYSKSLNTTSSTTMHEFFEKSIPHTLKEFEFCINTNNKFEIQDGVDCVFSKVVERSTIRECELEGNDVRNILQLSLKVKTVEFRK